MRKLSVLSALSLAFACAAAPGIASPQSAPQAPPGQGPPTPVVQAPADMKLFTSVDGRFKVLLPGTPKEQTKPITLEGGGNSTLHQFWVDLDNDNVTYMLIYNDFPADYASGSPQDLLGSTRDGMVSNKILTSDVAMDLYGVPGRAFTATDKQGWLYAVRQFLAGDRLYQLIVVDSNKYPALLTEQFMNSFRILKNEPQTQGAGAPPPTAPPASPPSQ